MHVESVDSCFLTTPELRVNLSTKASPFKLIYTACSMRLCTWLPAGVSEGCSEGGFLYTGMSRRQTSDYLIKDHDSVMQMSTYNRNRESLIWGKFSLESSRMEARFGILGWEQWERNRCWLGRVGQVQIMTALDSRVTWLFPQ